MEEDARDLFNSFDICPICQQPTFYRVQFAHPVSRSTSATISKQDSKLIIKIATDHFVNSNKSINLQFHLFADGSILFDNDTVSYLSLYDLSISIFKQCTANHFELKFSLKYDRNISSLRLKRESEYLSILDQLSLYTLTNDYFHESGLLNINEIIGVERRAISCNTPLFPFKHFDFNSVDKLASKFQSMRLLI